ncbi:MAG: HNH endonuclease [Chloroflexota bacterium]|nr:HNH endonuclease [Chloroflexota bacterium]
MTETELLVKSRRRCCLCVGLNFDLGVKKIQRAHIDHDPSNNDPNNLAALCLEHHDQYDTKHRLSKSITEDELKYHRDRLYSIIAQEDEELRFPRPNAVATENEEDGEDKDKFVLASARLLGRILEAYDRETLRLENKETPTGQPILRIGTAAIEEGDFDSAIEALMALLRLASAYYLNGGFRRKGVTRLPASDPFTAAIRLLEHFILTDLNLYERTVRRIRVYGMTGDTPIGQITNYTELPDISFDVVFTTIYHVLSDVLAWGDQAENGVSSAALLTARVDRHRLVEAVTRINTTALAQLLMGLGFIMESKGIAVPDLRSLPYISGTDRLAITYDDYEQDDEQLMTTETLNLIKQACLLILWLPNAAYKQVIQALEYRLAIFLGTATNDTHRTVSLQHAQDGVRRWAILPGYGGVVIAVKTDEERDPAQDMLRQTLATGKRVAGELKSVLLKKRPIDADPDANN